jgi:Malic enzyme, N-terminal domain
VNTQKFLDDPFYLGLRQKRVPEVEMTEFMDEFMREMTAAFPKLLVQFEVRYFTFTALIHALTTVPLVRISRRTKLSNT